MKKILFIIFFIIILFLVASCGNEPPAILSSMYRILIYQKDGLNIPDDSIFLSVYFIVEDDNGIDDILNVRIINLNTEYSWKIPVDIIKNSTVIWNEKKYVGYSFLEYNNAKSILTGEYLIEVTDSVGNIAESSFFVEVEGLISSYPYELPEIKYNVNAANKNKELKISGDKYSSCEIKIINKPKMFDGGRKKFDEGKKIVLNDKDSLPSNTNISVRINKNEDGTIVYFLKNITIK